MNSEILKTTMQIPEAFFNEEVRCDYLITGDMKKVWAVELDLLNEFMRVCKEYNIKFFASGGTLLGAVRHKGYIPWDDDIDVMMMRSEYNRLCEIAPKCFKHPYFFQTQETDPGSYRGHAQLRNSNTTGILKAEYHQKRKINQGIFIDIFPLDAVTEDVADRDALFRQMKFYNKKMNWHLFTMYPYEFHFRKNIIAEISHLIRHALASKADADKEVDMIYKQKQELILNYAKVSGKLLLAPFYEDRYVYDIKDFAECIYVPFEMLEIPIPIGYEKILDKTYGNWKKFVKVGSVHGGVIFDTEKPYTEYFK